MNPIASLFRRHQLVTFFSLAYALSWLGAVPYALGTFPVPIFPFGPLVAAFLIAAVVEGQDGVKGLLGQIVKWRVSPRWYAMALLLPFGVILAAIYANLFFGAPDPTPNLLASLPMAVPIFVLALLFPLQGAMGEEPGWRGFATPRLQARYSLLATSLLLGSLVALWHTPLFLTGIYGDAALRIVFLVTTTVLYTLLYNGTGDSLLLVMLFHASWNGSAEFLLAPYQGADRERAIVLFLMLGIAVAVVASVLAAHRLTRPAPNLAVGPAPATG